VGWEEGWGGHLDGALRMERPRGEKMRRQWRALRVPMMGKRAKGRTKDPVVESRSWEVKKTPRKDPRYCTAASIDWS